MNAARKLGLIAAAAAMALGVAAPVAQAAPLPTAAERNLASPMTFDTCYPRQGTDYYSKNKVGACTKTRLSYKHYACPEATCAIDSSASAYVETISNLLPGTRQVQVGHQMAGFYTTDLPETTRFGLTVDCTPKNTTGTAQCDQLQTTIVKSIAEWRTQTDEFRTFTLEGEDPADPASSPEIQAEKRTNYSLSYRMFVEEPPGSRSTFTTGTGAVSIRCDTVRQTNPAYGRGADCALRTDPTFFIDSADPLNAEAAKMVSEAIGGNTYPTVGGGWFIPGNSGFGGREVWKRPLTRIYYDTAALQAHRAFAENTCVTGWGANYQQRPDGGTNVCAAYPFDATIQGAAPRGATPGPTFSVRPVATAHYQELLSRLDTFLADNHVLDGDSYWVAIL